MKISEIQLPWEPKTFIFRGYNPYIGGVKHSNFMALGSHGKASFLEESGAPSNTTKPEAHNEETTTKSRQSQAQFKTSIQSIRRFRRSRLSQKMIFHRLISKQCLDNTKIPSKNEGFGYGISKLGRKKREDWWQNSNASSLPNFQVVFVCMASPFKLENIEELLKNLRFCVCPIQSSPRGFSAELLMELLIFPTTDMAPVKDTC